MTNEQLRQQPTRPTSWAPWWIYLVIILGANYLRRALLPEGSTPALGIVVALGFSAAVFVAITIIHRALNDQHSSATTCHDRS